ncbi:MAG: ankyrin repeat domain-containing protein [Lapillicoccus sp.]
MSEGPQLTDEQVAFLNDVVDLARAGEAATVADYVDRGVPVDLTNANGDTLLILAAYHEHLELARALLERRADPDRVNDRGQTALVAAVFRQHAPIVEALLAAGADPDLGGPDARATAAYFQLPEMTALLSRS